MNPKLEPHFGGGVDGDRFWPRKSLTTKVLRTLRAKGSVALFGPRRTGKSSILKETARILTADDEAHIVWLNLEGRVSTSAFISMLLAQLPPETKKGVLGVWGQIPLIPEALKAAVKLLGGGTHTGAPDMDRLFLEYWAQLAEGVERQALRSSKPIVFFFDELPYFCEEQITGGASPAAINMFLATLRRWRQANIPMAIAGSIGIREIARTHKLEVDHLNDLVNITVTSLPNDEAKAMLAALAKGYGFVWWTDEHSNAVVEAAADSFPSFLQRAMIEIEGEDARTPETIRVALKGPYRQEFERSFFQQFNKRLRRYQNDEKIARKLLAIVAETGTASVDHLVAVARNESSTPEDAEDLLAAMEEDAFLVIDPDDRTAGFAYRVVEAWWRSRP